MVERTVWRKSSYSTFSGNCVEFADLDNGGHAVRDSKDPTGPALRFGQAQWGAFISAASRGQFG